MASTHSMTQTMHDCIVGQTMNTPSTATIKDFQNPKQQIAQQQQHAICNMYYA